MCIGSHLLESTYTMTVVLIVVIIGLISVTPSNAAKCELFPPDSIDGNEFGFIFIPGNIYFLNGGLRKVVVTFLFVCLF
jgi:hypothetical protein